MLFVCLEDPVVTLIEDHEVVLRDLNARAEGHLKVIQYYTKVEERLEIEKSTLRRCLHLKLICVIVVKHVLKVSLLLGKSLFSPVLHFSEYLDIKVLLRHCIEDIEFVAHAHFDVFFFREERLEIHMGGWIRLLLN